jgi:hypothetical protein
MVWKARKHDPEFEKLLAECATVDKDTGLLTFRNLYASLHVNIGWGGNTLQIPYPHIVFFLTHGRWPKDGYHVGHIDDDPMNNRPLNLEETTQVENQKKRRGRLVYRSYGSGKYGYGMEIYSDKRDGRHYVRRNLSRGHGKGELKTIKKGLGGFDTLEEAEAQVAIFVEQIKEHGLDYMPEKVTNNLPLKTIMLRKLTPRIRRWRIAGQTIQQIADRLDYSAATIYKVVKDIPVDKRTKRA